jgi:hypothetical protein
MAKVLKSIEDLELPQVHFGSVQSKPLDWREVEDIPDSDDEELAETPSDVIAMLGFDPKELKGGSDAG